MNLTFCVTIVLPINNTNWLNIAPYLPTNVLFMSATRIITVLIEQLTQRTLALQEFFTAISNYIGYSHTLLMNTGNICCLSLIKQRIAYKWPKLHILEKTIRYVNRITKRHRLLVKTWWLWLWCAFVNLDLMTKKHSTYYKYFIVSVKILF